MNGHVTTELLALLDNELAPAEAARVKAHVDQCETCRAELARLETLRTNLGVTLKPRLARAELNQAAAERIRERLRAEQSKPSARKFWLDLAAFFEPLARRRYALAQLALVLLVVISSVSAWNATTYTAHADDQETIVLGQDQFAPGSPASVRVLVRSVTTEQPVAGAEVKVTLQTSSGAPLVYSGQTDETGTTNVSLDIPDNVEGDATLLVQTRSSLGQDRIERPIQIKRTYKLFLSTDKPVYQPGQMIHMRALALGAFDHRAAANQPVEFIVSNPNGDKVFRQQFNTSSFGIASADFQLASQLVTGKYNLQAILGDTESSRAVEVKPYVLPKFKVAIETERPYYTPGATVKGYVQADYFFGKPTFGARVELRGYAYDPERRQAVELFGQTDARGRFEFSFDLPPYFVGESNKDRAQFEITVAVIDQAEHREEIGKLLTVARDPLVIDAVPESGKLRPGVENIVYILVSTPDGRPVPASLVINGEQAQAGEYGLAEYRFTPGGDQAPSSQSPTSSFQLDVTARDNTGASTHKIIRLDAEQQPETILLRAERAAYRVGETLKVEALTTGSSGAVYLDMVKDNQTIAAFSAPVRDGRAVFAIDLAAEMFGTLELHAYRVLPPEGQSEGGRIVRDTRVVVVDRAQDINVAISSDHPVYRPAQTASLSFTTTLASNTQYPVPAASALGVGIVDESVYAVQDQAPGFARLYFLLEKELLEPKTQVQGFDVPTLLSPSVDPTAKKAQDDAAKASWAGAPTTVFGFDIRSRVEKLAALARQKVEALRQVSNTLSKTLIALPLLMLIVVVWGLRASGVLGKAMLNVGAWMGLGLLLSPICAAGLGILWLMADADIVCGGIVLLAVGGGWLAAWLIFALYGWRQRDTRTQLAAGLSMAYTLLGALMFFVAESGGDLAASLIGWAFLAFVLMIAMLVTFGQGLYLEGQRSAAWASVLVGLLWVPMVVLVAVTFNAQSLFARTLGNPVAYAGPAAWLAGCAVREPQTIIQTVVVKEPGTEKTIVVTTTPVPAVAPTKAPAAQPAATAMPTNTPVFKEVEPGKPEGQAAPAEPVRVRQYFPETMYWNPEALTDENGYLKLDILLADSITTWRLTALASTQDGLIGSQTYGLRVFQDFFIDLDLPARLTAGDEVAVPVAVYNYLTQTQQVRLEITPADWYELQDEPVKTITIAANDIDVTYFRIRAAQFGVGRLTVYGRGSKMSDAIAKDVNVVPNGTELRAAASDYVESGDTSIVAVVPAQAITGTARIEVKLYAGPASQIVEGLDALLRMPSGCFEQTSSTLYPDILILDYLNRTGRAAPEVRMKAESYIAAGYQRLLTYEVDGGGFSLFGKKPATLMHTAYGLMEFSDMQGVYAVDGAVIERTARWLLAQQNADGSWGGKGSPGYLESWGTLRNDRLPTTAYIAWALVEAGFGQDAGAGRAMAYLRSHWNEAEDAYTLSLVANALAAAQDETVTSVLSKLASLAVRDKDTARWSASAQSFTGASGNVADLETTALAAEAFLRGGSHRDLALAALRYLTRSKDSFGTWQSTQATILSLKAFLASLDLKSAPPQATLGVSLNGGPAQTVNMTAENADVVHILAFEDGVLRGENHIRLSVDGQNVDNLMYQVTTVAYVPWASAPSRASDPVEVNVTYDRATLAVDDELVARVDVTLKNPPAVQWAIVDLGVPPGFDVLTEDLDALVAQSEGLVTKVRRYEMTGSQIILYVENLDYKISFEYRLRAKVPLKVQTPPSSVYDYYNPETSGSQPPSLISVTARD